MDSRNWPGIILISLGVVLVALTVTAAAYGFAGWAVTAGIAGVLCLVSGIFLVAAQHRRIRLRDSGRTIDSPGH